MSRPNYLKRTNNEKICRRVLRAGSVGVSLFCLVQAASAAIKDANNNPGQPVKPKPAVEVAIETVTVTARRTAENLQTVPLSVTALSQKELQQQNIVSLSDLQYHVPSLNVSTGNTGRDFPIVSIRGVNGQATDGQGVVTYLNEVALPPGSQFETGGGIGLLYDLDSVQILKGPQGTLFGRDALGGAILYQTRRPTNEFGGYIDVTGGNYNDLQINGAVNVPIIDDMLLVRVAGNFADREGFTHSLGTANHPNGVDLDNRHFYAARGTVTFKPLPNVENDFIFDLVDDRNNGSSAVLTAVNPASFGAFLFPGLIPALAQQKALGPRTELATNNNSYDRATFTSFTDILRWDIMDDLDFRNIASSNRVWSQFAGDWDGTLFPVISSGFGGGGPQDTPYILQTYSEEAQLQGKSFGGKLKWTVGGLYQERPIVPKYNFILQVLGSLIPTGPSQSTTTSEGIYAQGTYDLSDFVNTLNFTAGVRESWDRVKDVLPGTPSASFSAPTWTLSLDYHTSDDTMVYLTARRGYHTGGINNLGGALAVGYQPEYIDDLEAGVKSLWTVGDVTAQTNFDVYRSDYTNFQSVQVVQVPGTNPPLIVSTIGNAGAARIWGSEFEGIVTPTEGLQLNALFDWMDFAYTKFAPGANIVNLQNTILANGAKYKYSIGARYQIPVDPDIGEVSVSTNWAWQSRTTFRFGPNLQPAYGLLSFGAEWSHIYGEPIDLSFFMTNATDQLYSVNSYDFTQGGLGFLGTRTNVFGEPRMFGFRLHYDFGSSE